MTSPATPKKGLRIPKTFEAGFLIFLVTFWLVSFLAERSSLGRILLGYRSELYPMSTFAVYTGPKQQQTSMFQFEIVEHPGEAPKILNDYDMFYPLQPPDIDDEISTHQLYSIVNSYASHCATEQITNLKTCQQHPAKNFTLPKDITEMWLRSIAHHLDFHDLPESITYRQISYVFDQKTFQITHTIIHRFMTFHPQRDAHNPQGWVASAPTGGDANTGGDDDGGD